MTSPGQADGGRSTDHGSTCHEKAENQPTRKEVAAKHLDPELAAGRPSPNAGPGTVPACLSGFQSTSVSLFPFAEPKFAVIFDSALQSRKRFADMTAKGRFSGELRSRKVPYRKPAGRLLGPIGRLFLPSGHGLFEVAPGAAGPCIGQTCRSRDRHQQAGNRAAPALRRRLRSSFRLWLRRAVDPEACLRRSQGALRAWRLADISTPPPTQSLRLAGGVQVAISLLAFALGVVAVAPASAPQHSAGSTAPIALGASAIAPALATHRLTASALASQRFGIERPPAWRPA